MTVLVIGLGAFALVSFATLCLVSKLLVNATIRADMAVAELLAFKELHKHCFLTVQPTTPVTFSHPPPPPTYKAQGWYGNHES